MGRFSTIEITNTPEPAAKSKPTGIGEPIKDTQYFLDLADKYFYRMEYEAALQSYSRALGIDPGCSDAWQGQVFSLTCLEEFHEADLMLTRSLGIVPENADLLALRALIAARTGEFDRACGYSDASLEAGGRTPLPLVVRGELFQYARRNSELCFDQACVLAPVDWKARSLIADAGLFINTRKSILMAHKYLVPALEKNASRPELYLRLARIRIWMHDRSAAKWALEQAIALDSSLAAVPELRDEAKKCTFLRRLLRMKFHLGT